MKRRGWLEFERQNKNHIRGLNQLFIIPKPPIIKIGVFKCVFRAQASLEISTHASHTFGEVSTSRMLHKKKNCHFFQSLNPAASLWFNPFQENQFILCKMPFGIFFN